MEAPNKFVEESILKKRKRRDEIQQRQGDHMMKKKRSIKYKKKEQEIKSAEKFVMDYRKKQRSFVLYKRKKHDPSETSIEATDSKVIAVVRINYVHPIAPQVETILKKLDLVHMFNAVLLKNTKETHDLIKKLGQYTTYGYPTKDFISQLLHKRGFAKIGTKRMPLNDNTLIEDNLGEHDLICIDDVVHELYEGGENFDLINSFLWAFKLASPSEKFTVKKMDFVKGGDLGNRGNKINDLLLKMI